eukprot:9491756-Pyramimonas_sp.AAC.1
MLGAFVNYCAGRLLLRPPFHQIHKAAAAYTECQQNATPQTSTLATKNSGEEAPTRSSSASSRRAPGCSLKLSSPAWDCAPFFFISTEEGRRSSSSSSGGSSSSNN